MTSFKLRHCFILSKIKHTNTADCSTMVERPTEHYKNRGIPVYLQETLEDPALQRASAILALTLYFPTPSTALSLSVLPSMPALYFSDRA